MKLFATYSIVKPESFYKEGFKWQDVRNHALKYYGVRHLFYKEVYADDFFINCMIELVGSINLSLHPNAEPVLTIVIKEEKSIKKGYQMDMDFQGHKYQNARI